jgi:hypothetical protein
MIRHFPLLAGIVGRVIISVVVEPEAVLKRVPVDVVQVTVLPLVTSVDDVIGNRCCWPPPSPGLCWCVSWGLRVLLGTTTVKRWWEGSSSTLDVCRPLTVALVASAVVGGMVGVGTVTTFRLPWILWKSLCASTVVGKKRGETHLYKVQFNQLSK